MRVMRRNDRQLPEDKAWDVLKNSEYGFLAMTNPEGEPYCIPLAYAVEGDTLYFHSGRRGEKLDSLRKNPRVCFTTVLYSKSLPAEYSMSFASCVAVGDMRFVTDEEERTRAMTLITAKYAPDFMNCAKFDRQMRGMPAVEILALKVEELCGKANKGLLDMEQMMKGHPGEGHKA